MDTSIGRDRFCEIFEGRAVVIAELPAGRSRVLAHVASQRAGRDDGSLRTRAEYMALFDLLLTHVSPATPANPKLLDETGRPTAIARAIEDYIAASRGKAGILRRGHLHMPYHRISASAAAADKADEARPPCQA